LKKPKKLKKILKQEISKLITMYQPKLLFIYLFYLAFQWLIDFLFLKKKRTWCKY